MSPKRILLIMSGILCGASAAQVPEIADPSLPDIAMVRRNPDGSPFIVFNPILCQQIGPQLCGFYRNHEYCHIRLGHGLRAQWPSEMELQADCCAARTSAMGEAAAAYQWFMNGGGSSPTHGWGWQRAQRIVACRR